MAVEFLRSRVEGELVLIVRDGRRSVIQFSAPYRWHWCDERFPDQRLETVLQSYQATEPVACELPAGRYYPRMWREDGPAPWQTDFSREWRASVRIGQMFAARLQQVFDHVEPCDQHRGVFSHELRMLYVLACQEVESACKAVLEANGATPVARHFNINDYSRLARPLRLVEWTVNLSADPTYGLITPFGEWAPGRGGQLKWYADHHEVKHSREKNLKLATLENTIEALAAVYVLRQAQFGSFDGEIGFARDEFEVSLVAPIWDDAEGYIPPSTLGLDGAQPLERLWVAQPYPNL